MVTPFDSARLTLASLKAGRAARDTQARWQGATFAPMMVQAWTWSAVAVARVVRPESSPACTAALGSSRRWPR